jgi:hypothetical protein
MKLHRGWIVVLLVLCCFKTLDSEANSDSLTLVRYFSQLLPTIEETVQYKYNDSVTQFLLNRLDVNPDYTPQSNRIGKISSEDGMVSIFSWNFVNTNSFYRYGCIIQTRFNNKINTIVPVDAIDVVPDDEVLKPDEWYGAIYYSIVEKKYKRKTYYTVLGWDGYDNKIARKFIDILSFNSKGELEFGDALFKNTDRKLKRVVFSFGASGSMHLLYDKKYNKIIFDHLSPSRPEYEGDYKYYGPDFSYDGFKFTKGKWVFQEMLDPRNAE